MRPPEDSNYNFLGSARTICPSSTLPNFAGLPRQQLLSSYLFIFISSIPEILSWGMSVDGRTWHGKAARWLLRGSSVSLQSDACRTRLRWGCQLHQLTVEPKVSWHHRRRPPDTSCQLSLGKRKEACSDVLGEPGNLPHRRSHGLASGAQLREQDGDLQLIFQIIKM